MSEGIQKISKEQIKPPTQLDILIQLASSKDERPDNSFIATALQLSISSCGNSPQEAIEKLVSLVTIHFLECSDLGIIPLAITNTNLLRAFILGNPVENLFQGTNTRVSPDSHEQIMAERIDIRESFSITQRNIETLNIETFLTFSAA